MPRNQREVSATEKLNRLLADMIDEAARVLTTRQFEKACEGASRIVAQIKKRNRIPAPPRRRKRKSDAR